MNITIDERSGCCPGVIRAIEQAERYLDCHPSLYSLGAIVHNNTEITRLGSKGLKIIGYEDLASLDGQTVLIRAHGEPPSTYQTAKEHALNLIDCTCPVVLKLQQKIAKIYTNTRDQGGQIIIFGKSGHAEVNGLVGQTDGTAFVVESVSDIKNLISSGKLSLDKPISIFSQTTKDPTEYERLCGYLAGMTSKLSVFNTICGQVSSRHPHLKEFASQHSVILFVSGRESSNGKILFGQCLSANPRSYMIEKSDEINPTWFKSQDSVGICGATSTPRWQLEDIAHYLSTL